MQLKCLVDQKEALRLGINAPHSTVVLEVDPATLTQDERDAIAVMLKDGHDLTAHGISNSNYWQPKELAEANTNSSPMRLHKPTVEGLREAIAGQIAAFLKFMDDKKDGYAKADAAKAVEATRLEEVRRRVILGELLLRGESEGRYNCAVYKDCIYTDEGSLSLGPDLEPAIAAYEARKAVWEANRKADAVLAREAEQNRLNEAKANREALNQFMRDTIIRLGTDIQRERLKRGYMESAINKEAEALLKVEAFTRCPLSPYVKQDESDIDVPEGFETEGVKVERRLVEDEIPKDDSEMAVLVAAEKLVEAWNPEAEVSLVRFGITYNSSDVAWTEKNALQVTVDHPQAGELKKRFAFDVPIPDGEVQSCWTSPTKMEIDISAVPEAHQAIARELVVETQAKIAALA